MVSLTFDKQNLTSKTLECAKRYNEKYKAKQIHSRRETQIHTRRETPNLKNLKNINKS